MPTSELKAQLQKHFTTVKTSNDFVFKQRDNVYRSVINAGHQTELRMPEKAKSNIKDGESDRTKKPDYNYNNSKVNLQSFSLRKIEHMKGYLPVRSSIEHSNEDARQMVAEDSLYITKQSVNMLDRFSDKEQFDLMDQKF